eukprot:1160316-Pelagomonas_calceolata.AAC.7
MVGSYACALTAGKTDERNSGQRSDCAWVQCEWGVMCEPDQISCVGKGATSYVEMNAIAPARPHAPACEHQGDTFMAGFQGSQVYSGVGVKALCCACEWYAWP